MAESSLDPRGLLGRIYVRDQMTLLYTKYKLWVTWFLRFKKNPSIIYGSWHIKDRIDFQFQKFNLFFQRMRT